MSKKSILPCVLLALLLIGGLLFTTAQAQVVQTPLKSGSLPQFVDPLPDLNIAGGTIETIVAGTAEIPLTMQEFKANVMPTGFVPATGAGTYTGTWVWGYRNVPAGSAAVNTYTGPVIVATKGTPTKVRYINNLGLTATSNVLAYTQSTDQTLHWANPLSLPMTTFAHYQGPIPAVPHLHGGEVPPVLDGGPDAWFLSSTVTPPGYLQHGPAYYTSTILGDIAAPNEAILRYPNDQEPANLWFHDHTLGATRLNVYAGIAGAYPLVDPTGTPFYNNLPAPVVPMVIQDRMFDTNGQLLFPNVGLNPLIHPFWMPEFIGDTILVNGKVWPFMNVAAQRYRFFVLNGSNARTYDLSLANIGGKVMPTMWQIGTDGGYLDFPVQVGTKAVPLVLQPGERADLIIDFTGLPVGTILTLTNTAKAPYPGGAPPKGSTTGSVMQFKVVAADANHNTGTFVPTATAALRGGAGQSLLINRLPGVPAGIAPATAAGPALVLPGQAGTPNVQKYRQLTLNEIMGPAGPQEILVNNSKWSGKRPDGSTINGAVLTDSAGNKITEYPNEGDTEVWDIINTTADTHPIHTHLTQFQIISRQDYDLKGYLAVYGMAFPGGSGIDMITGMNMIYPAGVFIPGFGPPLNYNTVQTSAVTGAQFIGGNPDVTPFLNAKKGPLPPAPNEMGFKDTIQVPPGQVTRIAIRFSPINSAAATPYAFNPGGADYVWHCHIIDHEDNEMMRPYQVNPLSTTRAYRIGIEY